MTNSETDPYSILGLSPGATVEEAHAAWRVLAEILHPDRFAESRPAVHAEAERRLKAVNEAWDILRTSGRLREPKRDARVAEPTATSPGYGPAEDVSPESKGGPASFDLDRCAACGTRNRLPRDARAARCGRCGERIGDGASEPSSRSFDASLVWLVGTVLEAAENGKVKISVGEFGLLGRPFDRLPERSLRRLAALSDRLAEPLCELMESDDDKAGWRAAYLAVAEADDPPSVTYLFDRLGLGDP